MAQKDPQTDTATKSAASTTSILAGLSAPVLCSAHSMESHGVSGAKHCGEMTTWIPNTLNEGGDD